MASAVTQTPTPPTETPPPDRMLNLMAWLELHRQHLVLAVLALVVVFGATLVWRHLASERERAGNAALLSLRARPGRPEMNPKPADFLKVAQEHAASAAAPRARLLAAAAYFTENQYAEAQAEFARVLESQGTGVLAAQAAYGVAASLDAQDKVDEAIAKYQDVITRFADDAVAGQARFALGRIHESRKQPENALRMYDEVLRDREAMFGSVGQAAAQAREELLRRHPELSGTNAPVSNAGLPAATPATP